MAHGKEMTNDSVLEFEQKRNIPTRYNRDLMVKTMQAMKRVDEIKKARQERFFDKRMDAHKGMRKMNTLNELIKHVDLIKDAKVKAFIMKKRQVKLAEKQAKQDKASGIHRKLYTDMESDDEEAKEVQMQSESEEEDQVMETQKVLAKVKNPKKLAKKSISKKA